MRKFKILLMVLCVGILIIACRRTEDVNGTESNFNTENADANINVENTQTNTGGTATIGDEKTGTLTLNDKYTITDLTAFYEAEGYYLAICSNMGINVILTREDPEIVINTDYGTNEYDTEPIVTLLNNDSYKAIRYFASITEAESHYCAVCIQNKNTDITTLITIATLAPMPFEEFKTECNNILATHSYGCFKNIETEGDFFYETK